MRVERETVQREVSSCGFEIKPAERTNVLTISAALTSPPILNFTPKNPLRPKDFSVCDFYRLEDSKDLTRDYLDLTSYP